MASSCTSIVLLVSCLASLSQVSCHWTVCKDNFNNQTCMTTVKAALNDKTLFWFGTKYMEMCPNGPDFTQKCTNLRPNMNDSIMSRMFTGSNVTTDSITSIMNITYPRPLERIYTGCGAEIKQTSRSTSFKIDPLNPHYRTSVDYSGMPDVSWSAKPDVKYTVVYYDTGYFIVHGIYVNADGGNITMGEAVKPHSGPLNTLDRLNIYVWVVFEQTNDIQVEEMKQYINETNSFMNPLFMHEFIQTYGLQGPVSFDIVRSYGDDYAAVMMRDRGDTNRCPYFHQKRLQEHVDSHGGLTFNLSSAEAGISIDLHFMTPDMPFPFCCSEMKTGAANVHVNYKSTGEIMAAKVRAKPMVHFVTRNTSAPARTTLQGQFFTLMLVNPTKELNTSTPNTDVHWLVVNINADDVANGDVVVEYMPPMPSATKRMYLALLYKQANRTDQVKNITGLLGSGCPQNTKCKFQVKNYVMKNSLVLSGLRQMDVKPDHYSKHQEVKNGMRSENEACEGMAGYRNPCPTGTGLPLTSSMVAIYAMALLAVVCQKAF
ncbi:uncharacterized protein [Haliotis cracherodii]|uniref:uncharacterized protein n=1 Tax=Haliotis cracherodii TaxID=6455 RepID=UPI0039EADF26